MTADTLKSITENTLIPISLVIVLVSCVVWMTTIYNMSIANEKAIARVETKQDEYNKNLGKIMEKLANIQGKLGIPTDDH